MNEFEYIQRAFGSALDKTIKRQKETNAKIDIAKNNIPHPHFQYCEVHVDENDNISVAYKTKSPWKWFSGKKTAKIYVKIRKIKL